MRSPRPTCWCRPQRLWGHSRGQGGRTGFCGARPGGGRIKGLYSASTGGTRLPRRRLSVPLQDNRARWAGPRARGNHRAHARPTGGTTESSGGGRSPEGGAAELGQPRRAGPGRSLGSPGSQGQESPLEPWRAGPRGPCAKGEGPGRSRGGGRRADIVLDRSGGGWTRARPGRRGGARGRARSCPKSPEKLNRGKPGSDPVY